MLNDSSATEVEVPVTGAAAEGSLQEASGKILQNIFNEDVVNLDDVPTTPPDEKDYMVETKELSHQKETGFAWAHLFLRIKRVRIFQN